MKHTIERERPLTTRTQALRTVQQSLLPEIENLYAIKPDQLQLCPDYEGCQNLVFFYARKTTDYVLRVSYRDDRTPDQIHAELDFIHFLYECDVRVSPPIKSREGRYVEVLSADDRQLVFVAFAKAPGHRLPDRGYRYRDGAPIEEYFSNWGSILGQMHRITQDFTPESPRRTRPRLLDVLADDYIPHYLPPSQSSIKGRFLDLLAHVKTFSTEGTAHGLIHGDFSDGNFVIDYTNGNITAFDFDDSAYCWFMYDIADAWRSGVGWTMLEQDAVKRREFMKRYFETLLNGYSKEHSLPDTWSNRLPTFAKLIEVEAVLGEFRDMSVNGIDGGYDCEMAYQLRCVEDDIPLFGFFESIYSPEHPFQLPCK